MLQFPDYYDPSQVGKLRYVQKQRILGQAEDWAYRNRIKTASEHQGKTVTLLIVDAQMDFVSPQGTLSVPGAVDDTRRLTEWLYSNMNAITDISASLDTHYPISIFFPTYWRNRKTGEMPVSNETVIDARNIHEWDAVFYPAGESDWNRRYVEGNDKNLVTWALHCLNGTPGYAIEPSLYEAMLTWSIARGTNFHIEEKGANNFTEWYSIMNAIMPRNDDSSTKLNTDFLDQMRSDAVYIAGQAKSHCVLDTVTSMVDYYKDSAPDMLSKMHVLMDATSSVVHPDVDFESIANAKYREYRDKYGLKLTTTQEPIAI